MHDSGRGLPFYERLRDPDAEAVIREYIRASEGVPAVSNRDETVATFTKEVADWTNYDVGATALGGWWITPTGAYVSLASSWRILDIPLLFPPLGGFRREFRQRVQWYHDANGGTTSANIIIRIAQITSVTLTSVAGTPTVDADQWTVGAWETLPAFETAYGPYYVEAQVNWGGAANVGAAIRHYGIEGRYVRTGRMNT